MIQIRNIQEMQKLMRVQKKEGSIGFIPTMGDLHEGHQSLILKSLKENTYTVVSIFVNPTQFNDPQDFNHYPKGLQRDIDLLKALNVDCLFTPETTDIYHDDFRYQVQENQLSQRFCGSHRPGHFTGVLTVVLKLFQIVQPDRAYFGEKDYQQYQLIQEMVGAFFIPIEIVGLPTIRNSKGLAHSSRNQRLSPHGLMLAEQFAQILQKNKPIEETRILLEELDIKLDYLEDWGKRRLAAVNIENVRLIDNVSI